jgi:hypothetical protein
MTTLLVFLIVVTTVVFTLGFGCGWYTRGAYTAKWKKRYDELVAHALRAGWLVTAKQILEAGIIQMPYVPVQVTEADYRPSIWQRLRHLWWRIFPGSFERSTAKAVSKERALAALSDVQVRADESGKLQMYFPSVEGRAGKIVINAPDASFVAATKGEILSSGRGWGLLKTDRSGRFECTRRDGEKDLALEIESATTAQEAPRFAYGNCKLDNENITREMVDQEAEKLKAEKA